MLPQAVYSGTAVSKKKADRVLRSLDGQMHGMCSKCKPKAESFAQEYVDMQIRHASSRDALKHMIDQQRVLMQRVNEATVPAYIMHRVHVDLSPMVPTSPTERTYDLEDGDY